MKNWLFRLIGFCGIILSMMNLAFHDDQSNLIHKNISSLKTNANESCKIYRQLSLLVFQFKKFLKPLSQYSVEKGTSSATELHENRRKN